MAYQPHISPSQIGEFINHGSCPKFAKLNHLNQSNESDFGNNWPGDEAFNPMNQLLATQGDLFEDYVYDKFIEEYAVDFVMTAEDWDGNDPTEKYQRYERNYELLLDMIREAAIDKTSRDKPMLLEQVPFVGNIEAFDVSGDADMVVLVPTEHNGVDIRIFDIKASWEEKTYHRVQTASYTLLLRWLLSQNSFDEEISVNIDGGIIHRETELPTQLTLDGLPSFDVRPVEDDVQRLLNHDSDLYEAMKTNVDDIDYHLNEDWKSGPFKEYAISESVGDADIRLLEISRGEQEVFRQHGFDTIYDVADIIPVPEQPRPYEYDMPEVKDAYEDAVRELRESGALSESIVHLAQKAQSLLNQIDPDHPNAYKYKWEDQQWKIGVGQGQLPDDDPQYDLDTIENGSMIRVYLNVQLDHIRDSVVMLSAQVDCGLYDGEPQTVTKIVEDIPSEPPFNVDDPNSLTRKYERELLDEFLSELFNAIKYMGNLTDQEDEAPLHFYFYEPSERETLVEVLRRNDTLQHAQAFRDLLSMKAGVDQKMVSFIEPEIEQRIARNEFSTGLIQQYRNLFPPNFLDNAEKLQVQQDDWDIWNEETGKEYDLQRIFSHQLFNTSDQYTEQDVGIDMFVENADDPFSGDDPDGWYPIRSRFGAQIPLEYIWGCEEIRAFDESWTNEPLHTYIVKRFLYYGDEDEQIPISKREVKALGRVFAACVEHIERGINYKNADIEKHPIQLDSLDSFSLGESELQTGLQEYLDLEYETQRREVMDLYKTPLEKRIVQGNAVPFRVTDAVEVDGVFEVEGELLYDEFDFIDAERIAGSARVQGSDESSGGSRRLATPLRDDGAGWTEDIDKPEDIQHSPIASIETFDPSENKISMLFFPNGGSQNDKYQTWHKNCTQQPDESGYLFAAGEEFVLDEQADDLTSERTRQALLHAPGNNMIYNHLSEMSNSNSVDTYTDVAEEKHIDDFLSWLDENYHPSPNKKQEAFIRDVDSKFHLLQGPPGTGKTSGATSLAVLARAYARGKSGDGLRGMITGASNKAIDEVMEDVHDALLEFQEKTDGETPLSNVELIRLTGNPPDDQLEQVSYLDTYSSEARVARLYQQQLDVDSGRQTSLGEAAGEAPTHTLIFTTPSTFYKFAQHHPDVKEYNKGLKASEQMDAFEQYRSLFDLLCVDEASMLSVPQLAMSGAFISENAQVILSGDQRQMPPVQQYDWLDEDRRTIEEVVPFLSSLDFFRLLRGDELEQLTDDHWATLPDYNNNIPITRLETTYRCHTDVASFLRRWVYEQDGIKYDSDQTYTIPPVTAETVGVEHILDHQTPITLVLHEDSSSRQSNQVEAKIAKNIIDDIPPSETTGVVTPHNAQKGLLNTMTDRAQVDTVERFQGGQRDVMVMSATVSDPDYLSNESEFILNPNRLNVALSRMKKKLVVIAPKSLFTLIPNDTEEYEDSTIWKGLYKEVDVANSTPRWTGVLEDITETEESVEDNVRIEVYSNT